MATLERHSLLAASYLSHLSIAVSAGDYSAPYRTFFDNWFAYYAGGPFLNRNGRPKWFNQVDPLKGRVALKAMHYVSSRAQRILEGDAEPEPLIKDHAVPVAVLRDHLLHNHICAEHEIERVLLRHYRLGAITAADDALLSANKLRSCIGGSALSETYDAIQRYSSAGVLMAPH